MKILFFFLLTTLSSQAFAQYYIYETSLTCPTGEGELLSKGHQLIKSILSDMVTDNQLLNFNARQIVKEDTILLAYRLPAESDADLKRITTEWKQRFSTNHTEISNALWAACPLSKDTIVNKTKITYPFITSDLWGTVAVVENIDELPEPDLKYNIVFDFTTYSQLGNDEDVVDSSAVNWGISNIGRILNLHVAAGIPKENINFVVAVHGAAVPSFFDNEAYQNKYKMDNPNLPLLEELNKAGVKFMVCGQSMAWRGYKKQMLSQGILLSLSAQTTLSSYQMKGYALKVIE